MRRLRTFAVAAGRIAAVALTFLAGLWIGWQAPALALVVGALVLGAVLATSWVLGEAPWRWGRLLWAPQAPEEDER